MKNCSEEQTRIDYVRNEVHGEGGWRELWAGFRLRTFPYMLGRETKFSFSSLGYLFLKVLLLLVAAGVPIAARKLGPSATPTQAQPTNGSLWDVITRLDSTDWALVGIVVSVTIVGKLADKLAATGKFKSGGPEAEVASVLEHLPLEIHPEPPSPFKMSTEHCKAIQACLVGIRHEIGKLLLDDSASVITDVVYLQFTDASAKYLSVRTRIYEDKAARPFEAKQAMAYYVALLGECMAENDLHSGRSPFKPQRISVPGKIRTSYRSMLFVPIITSELDTDGVPVDYCVGVICVHSPKPYRFWRFGDHRRSSSTFCNVAHKAIEPYSKVIRRLSSPTPNRLKVLT